MAEHLQAQNREEDGDLTQATDESKRIKRVFVELEEATRPSRLEQFVRGWGKTRDFLVNFVTISAISVAVIFLLLVIWRNWSGRLAVGEIAATKSLIESGVTSDALARTLKQSIDAAVSDLDNYMLGEFSEDFSQLQVSAFHDIEISENGLSFSSVAAFLEHMLPFRSGTISGYVTGIDGNMRMVVTVHDTVIDVRGTSLEDVTDKTALGIIRAINPATYVAILYRRGDHEALTEAQTLATHQGLALKECYGGQRICPTSDYAFAEDIWGKILQDAGDFDGAIERYRRASFLAPKAPWPENHLGSALWNSGNTAEAVEHFSEAARRKPDDKWSYYDRAELQITRKTPKQPPPYYYLRIAIDFLQAISIARAEGKAFPQGHLGLALVYAKNCWVDSARVHYDKANAADADNLERIGVALSSCSAGAKQLQTRVYLDLARLYSDREQLSNAAGAYRVAQSLKCGASTACGQARNLHLMLGDTLRASYLNDDAAAEYSAAVPLDVRECGNSGPTNQSARALNDLGVRLLQISQVVAAHRRGFLQKACHALGAARAVLLYRTDLCEEALGRILRLSSTDPTCRAYFKVACASVPSPASRHACDRLKLAMP